MISTMWTSGVTVETLTEVKCTRLIAIRATYRVKKRARDKENAETDARRNSCDIYGGIRINCSAVLCITFDCVTLRNLGDSRTTVKEKKKEIRIPARNATSCPSERASYRSYKVSGRERCQSVASVALSLDPTNTVIVSLGLSYAADGEPCWLAFCSQ